MKTLNLQQGTPEWIEARAKHFTASEAPAMLGLSKYQTRQELLQLKSSGIAPDVDDAKQRLFDRGHAAEAAARPLAEEFIGDELYPATGMLEVEGLPLLASFDGITMAEDLIWENKLWNAALAADIEAGVIGDTYWPQLEQQLLVSGAEKAYFTASDSTPDKTIGMWYQSVPKRRQQLIQGWKQFAEDLASFVPVEVIPAAVATPTLDLPVVSIQTSGAIAIHSNLRAFGEALNSFIERLPTKPSTDQEFADCKAALTKLKTAEETLDSEEARALSQMTEIDEMRREKKLYQDLARTTRLALEKLVTARESAIKVEIVAGGKAALAEHIVGLNTRLGKPYMPAVAENFATVIKNKRTITSLRDAVDTELARCKIAANEIADKIQINLNSMRELAADHAFLFADTASIILKANDDLLVLVKSRIAEHKAEQQKKLDDERAKIRAEEEAKAAQKAKDDTEKARQAAEASELGKQVETNTHPPAASSPAPENAPASVRQTEPSASVSIHQVAAAAQTQAQDTAWKIAGLVADMQEHERVLVLHFCDRIIDQRQPVAA
jgi:predicted phage-related endonuclease